MKVIIDDFNYKGKHYDKFECDLPQFEILEDVDDESLVECITESLIKYITDSLDEMESFMKGEES